MKNAGSPDGSPSPERAPADDLREVPETEKRTTPEEVFKPKARVYVRQATESREDTVGRPGPWTGSLGVESARAGLEYERGDLKAEIDAEVTGKAKLKDAYLELDAPRRFKFRVGQFKLPFSSIQMTSSWTLPMVRRGLLDKILTDRLQIADRRPGAQVEWSSKTGVRPEVLAGVWQGSGYDGEFSSGEPKDGFSQNLAARAAIRPGGFEAGLSGEWRSAEPVFNEGIERYWAAGADLTYEGANGLRVWAEAMGGESWIDENLADGEDTYFTASRLILAWRAGGNDTGAWFLEPFAFAGGLDPDSEVVDDLVYEAALGLNGGRWKTWRVQIQAETRRLSRNTPDSIGPTGDPLTDRTTVLVQLGAKF